VPATAACCDIGGRAADLIGRRRCFLVELAFRDRSVWRVSATRAMDSATVREGGWRRVHARPALSRSPPRSRGPMRNREPRISVARDSAPEASRWAWSVRLAPPRSAGRGGTLLLRPWRRWWCGGGARSVHPRAASATGRNGPQVRHPGALTSTAAIAVLVYKSYPPRQAAGARPGPFRLVQGRRVCSGPFTRIERTAATRVPVRISPHGAAAREHRRGGPFGHYSRSVLVTPGTEDVAGGRRWARPRVLRPA